VGVLIYGIAEASTAYLVTKITDPPPPPAAEVKQFTERETRWHNKHEFLSLPLEKLDRVHMLERDEKKPATFVREYPEKTFS
jgi:hypothetical protein